VAGDCFCRVSIGGLTDINFVEYATLGATGIKVSRLAFGAGPVAGVMVEDDATRQQALVRRVLDAGINWIDTAAGYGNGRAEQSLGDALARLGASDEVHIATKVRLRPDQLTDIVGAVESSVAASLQRLRLRRVTLLQLHNAITTVRGEEPDSITSEDVLRAGGVLDAFMRVVRDGRVLFLGVTAIGEVNSLNEVIACGKFSTIQVPYSLVNPSAGCDVPESFDEANYRNIMNCAADQRMGVFAIRVYAGGVLAGNPPSRHTLSTKYFPLQLFERDRERIARLREIVPPEVDLKQAAVRFAISHRNVTSAILGFSEPEHVDEAVAALNAGPFPAPLEDAIGAYGYL